jgi:predicted PurR-regulated permease PerM
MLKSCDAQTVLIEVIMPRVSSPGSTSAETRSRPFRVNLQRLQAGVTIPRALAYLALVGLAVLFVWLTLQVDLVIFGGVLFAISLRRATEALSRLTRLPVGWSLLAVVLLIVAFFSAIGWFFSQAIAGQITELSQQLPAAAAKVGNMISQSAVGQILSQHVDTSNVQTSPTTLLQSFFGVAANVVEVVGGIVVLVFLAVYFAAEAGMYAGGLVRLVPPARRARAAEILHETASAMWYWMLGRLFSMTVLGIITAIGLWLLGVPLPVALGFLAGIMIFVPYIGAIASAIPSVIIAASINLTLALYVIALYLGVHLVEGYILVPLVQRRAVHLPPALTLSAQVILGFLAGFIGLLFATPLVAAGLVLVRMIYVEDILGDRESGEPAPFEAR